MASIWYLWTQRAGSRGGEASDPGQLSGRHAPAGAEDTSLARGVTAHGRRGAQMTRSARNSRPGSWRNLSRLELKPLRIPSRMVDSFRCGEFHKLKFQYERSLRVWGALYVSDA